MLVKLDLSGFYIRVFAIAVFLPLMPLGVEHRIMGEEVLIFAKSVFTFDAVRR